VLLLELRHTAWLREVGCLHRHTQAARGEYHGAALQGTVLNHDARGETDGSGLRRAPTLQQHDRRTCGRSTARRREVCGGGSALAVLLRGVWDGMVLPVVGLCGSSHKATTCFVLLPLLICRPCLV
jgi:hypothetical protein